MARANISVEEVYQRLREAGWLEITITRCVGADLTLNQLLSAAQDDEVVRVRQDLWLTLWRRGLGYSEIGRLFGRHHQTIAYGIRAARARQKARRAAELASEPVTHVIEVDGYPCIVEEEVCRAS